jgi:hypothetical protein
MKLGVALPLIDATGGSNPGAIREFARTAEEISYHAGPVRTHCPRRSLLLIGLRKVWRKGDD